MKLRFSRWVKWSDRAHLPGLCSPGVYALVVCQRDISETPFRWMKQIVYFGMTNGQTGLRGRLAQFRNTIGGGAGHGGAQRFRHKYPKSSILTRRLYVSVCPFDCNVVSPTPADLRTMGDVARYEYVCLARYMRLFRRLPEFNDKARSPKA